MNKVNKRKEFFRLLLSEAIIENIELLCYVSFFGNNHFAAIAKIPKTIAVEVVSSAIKTGLDNWNCHQPKPADNTTAATKPNQAQIVPSNLE
ncbi:hypothetical protein [Dichelobacter nodosus]|uniref:hypothetical protein n=1 Tax=Dichelobacter nodosus TaxID=870 RepID=UPI000681599F|nr:hypothetical protein [Dichelobacter nodosus]KNZ39573.1 hypothetical protein AKG33_03215 [Dichelobacter nodosus]TGA66019.1 hypothetical protein E5E99_03090 [Dichelobacter nodosus]